MESRIKVETIGALGNRLAAELLNDRKWVLNGDVAEEDVEALTNSVNLMARDPAPITLIIASFGGMSQPMMGLISIIREAKARGCPVTGRVAGYAMSAGALVLQACDHRVVSPESTVMVHGVTTSITHADIKEQEADMLLTKKMTGYLAQLLAGRNTSSDQKYHDEKWWLEQLQSNRPLYYFGQEIIEAGLADELV